MKYSVELAEKIGSLIADEFLTVSQVCKATGISRQTFYSWMDTKDDFREEVNQAMAYREAEVKLMVFASLKRKLEGYTTTVEKDVYAPDLLTGKMIFKQRTVTRKECPPDLRTIKMMLDRLEEKKNIDRPSQWEETIPEKTVSTKEIDEEKVEVAVEEKPDEKLTEEKLDTVSEDLSDFPPKNEQAKQAVQMRTSRRERKAEQQKKQKVTAEKIKKSVKFVKF